MHLLTWKGVGEAKTSLEIWLERDVSDISGYAILSHRWGKAEDEVSFEDMLVGRAEQKKGYKKLVSCCEQARNDGLRHVWVDTCCINKASSAELSETITSMFMYYEQAKVCYAFLDDVIVVPSPEDNPVPLEFSQSQWFTRGWTLQELIAPQHVKFFDRSWKFIGLKTDKWLTLLIESATGIDSVVLSVPSTVQLMSVAKRMSWAARRKTTRVEDMAYSLMGIFGVFMPPLYGEGSHAFIRLQEAIMKAFNDHTIFAWTLPPKGLPSPGLEHVSTMLALSPEQFEYSSAFKSLSHHDYSQVFGYGKQRYDYATTNAGLLVCLPLLKLNDRKGIYAAFLACTDGKGSAPSAVLLRAANTTPPGHFWRIMSNQGPIERAARPWFSALGQLIGVNDIYVLPRFTTLSADNIESSWNTLDNMIIEKGFSPERRIEILASINQVPDPYFPKLAFLHQARQMITTNQADELFNIATTRVQFPRIIPYRRDQNFCGRSDVLQRIRALFFPPTEDAGEQRQDMKRCILTGMGGVGKTHVAVEFCHECIEANVFDAVFWISAATIETINDGFRRHASELGLIEQGASPQTTVHKFLQWLQEFEQYSSVQGSIIAPLARWLLVFDDADSSLLENFLPSSGSGFILITSRSIHWWSIPEPEIITLEPFTDQESSEMFAKLTKSDWDFLPLTHRLGGLPLYIAHSAAYLIRTDMTIDECLREFDEHESNLLLDGHKSYTSPDFMLESILSRTLACITLSSYALLKVVSFLDPDLIKTSILTPNGAVPLEAYPRSEVDLIQSRMDLQNLVLVAKDQERDGMYIHRRIQTHVREKMDREEFQAALSTAVALVSSACALADSSHQTERQVDDLLPHALKLRDFAAEMKDSEHKFGTLTKFAGICQILGAYTISGGSDDLRSCLDSWDAIK